METQTEFQAEMQRFDEQHVRDLMNKISDRLDTVRELDTECENYWLKRNRQLAPRGCGGRGHSEQKFYAHSPGAHPLPQPQKGKITCPTTP